MLKKIGKRLLNLSLCFSLILLLAGILAVAAAGIWAGGLDTDLSEDIFFAAGRDRTTRLYYRTSSEETEELASDRISGFENALYCPIEEMSPHLIQAFVAIEDKRFFDHAGVDWARTLRAAGDFIGGGDGHFGGSSITQQLVKNLTGENERSISRKVSEMIRAVRLEEKLSKREILEQYLNVVNLSENCYGVRTASNAYFSKEPSALSLEEAATIAAITNNPSRYNPIRHPEANKKRRDVILAQMRKEGMIGEDEYRAAKEKEVTLNVNREVLSGRVNSWFADMVVKDVIKALQEERKMSEAAAGRLVYCGGLKIFTTVDPALQQAVEAYYRDVAHFPLHEGGERAESAMMIVDPHSGDILAVAGAVGEKQENRIQNFATDTKRPSGSLIKPLSVYAPALERGLINWATVFDDIPLQFRENGAPWPRNSPDLYRGLTTVKDALTHSVNTVAVSVLERLGRQNAYRFLTEKLGFSSLDAQNDGGAAALALGQQHEGVTLRELLGGYTALAGDGIYRGTRSFYAVFDSEGRSLLTKEVKETRAISSETASLTTLLLRQVTAYGTASDLTLTGRVDVAGKTGTSSKNCDKWFMGYTPELLAGVWYGYEYPHALKGVKGNPALRIFDDLMQEAISLRTPQKRQFDTAEGLVAVRYCKDSGKLPGEACTLDPRGDRFEIGYFKKGTEPHTHCTCHVPVSYCDHGGVAADTCPSECCHQTALLRVERQFPRQIKVLDAPYTYGGEVFEKQRELSNNEPYYALNYDFKPNFGIGMGIVPYNRLCPGHEGDADFWRRRAAVG